MKKLRTAALLAVAALALAGCTAATESAPEAATPTVSAEAVPVVQTPAPTATVDVKQAKADAIAAGRPEAAWDKNCVAWKFPQATTEGQKWANKMGQAWLESHDAKCPDQIVFPSYYVDSFAEGARGELVVTLDAAALAESAVKRDSDKELKEMAREFSESMSTSSSDFRSVTFVVDGTNRAATVKR